MKKEIFMPFEFNDLTTTELVHTNRFSMLRIALSNTQESKSSSANVSLPEISAVITNSLLFREAFSVFNSVISYDVQSQLKSKRSYEAWLRQNNLACEIIKRRSRRVGDDNDELKKQLKDYIKQNKRVLLPYQKATKRYLRYMYQHYLEQNMINDPWFSVHPDEVFFETFSKSQKVYCRLSIDFDLLDAINLKSYGTSTISIKANYSDAIEKIRSYRPTKLSVEVAEKQVSSEPEKTKLDNDYVRGLLQVNSAMSQTKIHFELHSIDLHNLCYLLSKRQLPGEASSLRYELTPGQSIKIILEPEDVELTCVQSIYKGDTTITVRHWFRNEIQLLTRLVSRADKISVFLSKDAWPAFYVIHLDGISLTLGISGWSAGDWTRKGTHDLLQTNALVDDFSRVRLLKEIAESKTESIDTLSKKLKLPNETIIDTLQSYAKEGLVFYDFVKNKYRYRQLFQTEINPFDYRFTNKLEAKARSFVEQNNVQIDSESTLDGHLYIAGTVKDKAIEYQPEIALDDNLRLVSGSCFCHYYASHKLNRGPCEHMLSLRMLMNSKD